MNSEVDKALKLSAVQIVAHSLWLQGFSDKDRMRQADSVRLLFWLILNGVATIHRSYTEKLNVYKSVLLNWPQGLA